MNENTATFPKDMYDWIILRVLGKKVIARAGSINKKNKRVADTDGHEVDEAVLEGGVKVRPKIYDISKV